MSRKIQSVLEQKAKMVGLDEVTAKEISADIVSRLFVGGQRYLENLAMNSAEILKNP